MLERKAVEVRESKARVLVQPFTMHGEIGYTVLDRQGMVIFEGKAHPVLDQQKVESMLSFLLSDYERMIDQMLFNAEQRSARVAARGASVPLALPSETHGLKLER